MGARSRARVWCLLALAGCTPAAPEGTGAREVVQSYHEALLRHDWPRAYAALHPETRRRFSPEQFTRLVQRHLGFEPTAVHVRSCEENGSEASARVLYEGRDASGGKLYKDAVALRYHEEGWRIVLPSNFGRRVDKGVTR